MRLKIVHFSIFLGIILIFSGGFLSESFAIDFIDSSGYTPSWAQGKGYHTVLVQCMQYSGDGSSDSYWCLEWMAYVLDQGVDNFPQSTSSESTTNTVTPNDLMKGKPYSGTLLQYLPPNSYYEKYLNDDSHLKPNHNYQGWVIGEPFTLPDDKSSTSVKDIVSQMIHVTDNTSKNHVDVGLLIIEFENDIPADSLFKTQKTEIETEIKSDSAMEDISMRGPVYFDDCIAYEKNFDLPDESSRYVCVIDKYIVSVVANQSGGYVTDNYFRYVLPSEIADYVVDKIGKNIDTPLQKIIDNQRGGISISDKESCVTSIDGASWNPTTNICVSSSFTVNSGETLYVSKNVGLWISKGVFKNSGTINILGVMDNYVKFENFGTINISSQLANDGNFDNHGNILINNDASLVNGKDGTLNNYNSISNNDALVNFGTINNHCDATISGNPIGNDFGFGDEPVKQISCDAVIEKKESMPAESNMDVKTTTEDKTSTKSDSDEPTPAWAMGLAAFIVFGIPIIIIGLIIWKIKQRKKNKK